MPKEPGEQPREKEEIGPLDHFYSAKFTPEQVQKLEEETTEKFSSMTPSKLERKLESLNKRYEEIVISLRHLTYAGQGSGSWSEEKAAEMKTERGELEAEQETNARQSNIIGEILEKKKK